MMMMITYTLKGSFGSEVRVTLKETFPPPFAIFTTNNNSNATLSQKPTKRFNTFFFLLVESTLTVQ